MEASMAGALNKKSDPMQPESSYDADPRDQIFKPTALSLPDQFLPKKENIVILDQGQEGASVGFGLAGMINYLMHERGDRELMSPRMLYQMAKVFGGADWNQDSGANIRDGLKGWYTRGVCPEAMWPYIAGKVGELTPDRERAALKNRPKSYERVPKEALRAALFECHAGVVAATIHEGWGTPKDGIIPFDPTITKKELGGHAFAVLGYTPDGFIVQNSWGSSWGGVSLEDTMVGGLAIWSNADFEENFQEAWIARLYDEADAIPKVRRAGYQTDRPFGKDHLNIMPDVQAICALLAARDVKPPLALGLFGNWGSGKSFFMNRMYEEIESLTDLSRKHPEETVYCDDIVQIRFNVWHYLDANLWASLVSEIFRHLFERISGPKETEGRARERLKSELRSAQGLYQQSRMHLDEAEKERKIAQSIFEEKVRQAEAKQSSFTGAFQTTLSNLNQLSAALVNDTALQKELDSLAEDLGVKDLAKSYSALQEQVYKLGSLKERVHQLLRFLINPKGFGHRILLLVALLTVPALVGWLINHFSPDARGILQIIHGAVEGSSGLILGAAAWLAQQIIRGRGILDRLEDAAQKAEKARQEQLDTLTRVEKEAVEASKKEVEQASTCLEAARNRVEMLENELSEMAPYRQMQRFIVDRGTSEDYRKQLGLISLIHKDFERLSDLYEKSEKAEENARAFLKTGQTPPEGSGPLIPFQRIILYIDDLDRCQPKRVIEVLEAIHLLLNFPLFIAVVAVDPRWLRRCLEMHYPDLLAMKRKGGSEEDLMQPSTPQDYLEKIFQIPFYLHPVNLTGYKSLIQDLAAADVAITGRPTAVKPPDNSQPNQDPSLPAMTGAQEQPLIVAGSGTLVKPEDTVSIKTSNGVRPIEIERLNPEQLKFQSWELNDMERMGPLFLTPRAIKRFVNTYRLIRVAVPPRELLEFEGTAELPGRYRVAMTLLAVVAGHPNLAPYFLQRLIEQAHALKPITTWEAFLGDCLTAVESDFAKANLEKLREFPHQSTKKTRSKSSKTETSPPTTPLPSSLDEKEWCRMIEALQTVSTGEFMPADLKNYYDLVPKVARFSFSVSDLPDLEFISGAK
jgi:hypothetical protein